MGRYRGHRIPDEYEPDYPKVEGQEEYWYWYMVGYEDGLSDDYNRKVNVEVKRLQADVSSLVEQAAARERVLNVLSKRYEELQALGNPPTDKRIKESHS